MTSPESAIANETRPVRHVRPPSYNPLGALRAIGELPEYLDLFLTLCLHRASVRYKQSLLGVGWALLQPLLLMAVYVVIFSILVQMPSDGVPYPLFVFAGLLPWIYFSSAVTAATGCLVSHIQIVTKVYFPREILPLSYVIVGLIDFAMASCVLALMMIFYHVRVGMTVLGVIPVLAVETVFVAALSLVFSAIQVRFRDLGLAMPLLMQLWMFASPVVYPMGRVPARLLPWYELNPMAGILENFRRVVLLRQPLDYHLLWISLVISSVLLMASYAYFKLQEATMADVI